MVTEEASLTSHAAIIGFAFGVYQWMVGVENATRGDSGRYDVDGGYAAGFGLFGGEEFDSY